MTNKDKYVYLLEPTMYDYIMKIQHGTQIVYPKDLGYIAARAGIQDGQKILEIGTGSGSMTSFVASIVKPRGHVYTFDVDEKFMKIAEKNIQDVLMWARGMYPINIQDHRQMQPHYDHNDGGPFTGY